MSEEIAETGSRLSREALALLRSISAGGIRVDTDGRIVELNAVAEELVGLPRSEVIGKSIHQVYRVTGLHPGQTLKDPLERTLSRGEPSASGEERILLRVDGAEFTVRDRATPVLDENGEILGAWLIFDDLTELRALQREQQWLDAHDPVTSLPNRRSFEGSLERAISVAQDEGQVHAFGYLDLDDFEVFTDTFGVIAGDELLKQVAKILSSQLSEGDVVARLMADRFGILIADCRRSEVQEWAERLRRAVSKYRFRWHQERFEITVSIGMVPIDNESGDLVKVLGAADAASDKARDHALEFYQFNNESSGDIYLAEHYGEMRWLSRIHRALKKNRFRLFRQPIVSTAKPDLESVPLYEVLIRMLDDKDGVILPNEFIHAAERFHIISTLDRWVVRTVLQQLDADADTDSLVAINLSGQSLSEARFLDYVLEELAGSSCEPSRICFEITETTAVGNLERAKHFIRELRQKGCRFVLDDFGSGLSSFAYLMNLPVDFLKIDRGFVQNMVNDPVQNSIVRSIHQIGHVMGFKIIAEGVETEETMLALKELGIDYAQGFWIKRPALWEPRG